MDPLARKIIETAIPKLSASLLICDNRGFTIYASRSFTELSGYTTEDMAKKTPGDILQGPDTESSSINSISTALENNKSVSTKITNYCKNGTKIVFILDIQPVFDVGDGGLIGFIGLQQNATELDKEIIYTEKLTMTLISELQLRNNLLSLLRHDVRDSLSCIKALEMMGELNNSHVSKAVQSCLDAVERCVTKTQHSIARNVATEVIEDIMFRAQEKHITINNNIPDNLILDINECYFFIALRNFILNSIKFSASNACIDINASKKEGGEGNMHWSQQYIHIKDTGAGMSPDLIEKLLTNITPINLNLNNQNTLNTGSRSGFILCRQLLAAQGHKLYIESELNKGTTVTIGSI